MTTVINIHKALFMVITGVMTWLWQCNDSLTHIPSNKVLPKYFMPQTFVHQSKDGLKTRGTFYLWCYVTHLFSHPWPWHNLIFRIDFCVCLLPFLFVISLSQRLLHQGLTSSRSVRLPLPDLSNQEKKKIQFHALFTHAISCLCFVGLWLWEEETAGNQRLVFLNVSYFFLSYTDFQELCTATVRALLSKHFFFYYWSIIAADKYIKNTFCRRKWSNILTAYCCFAHQTATYIQPSCCFWRWTGNILGKVI